MTDTARSLSALQTLLADNVTGDISPQDVRDFLVSVYRQQQCVEIAANDSTTLVKAIADYVCDGTADQTEIASAITAAAATVHKRVHLNAGTYNLSGATSGNLISLGTTTGIELYGDGMGRTILSFPASVTLTDDVNIVYLNGFRQWVHDLTITVGLGTEASYEVYGINCYMPYPCVERVEITGIFGAGNAGGAGIHVYANIDDYLNTTTLGTNITAGADQVATPPSMTGIYPGCWLRLTGGANTENIVVESVTSTTFTADYVYDHTSSETLRVASDGGIFGVFRDCFIHDIPKGCGCIVNSRGNLFENIRLVKVGSTGYQHGFYVQQGGNEFRNCYVEGAYGYSFQLYQVGVDHSDQSGTKIIGLVSVNPVTQHLIIQGYDAASSENPHLLAGAPNNRFTVIQGCVFRCTPDVKTTPAGCDIYDSAAIIDCHFEDANLYSSGADIAFNRTHNRSTITGCIFNSLRTGATASAKSILVKGGAVVMIVGNTFRNVRGYAIEMGEAGSDPGGAGIIVSGNYIYGGADNTNRLVAVTDGCKVINNYIECNNSSGRCLYFEGETDIEIAGNTLVGTASTHYLVYQSSTSTTGSFHDNILSSGVYFYQTTPYSFALYDNAGQFAQLGEKSALITLTKQSGKFWPMTSPSSGYQWSGYVVKPNTGLSFALATSSDDNVWCGVNISETLNGAYPAYIAGKPGDVVPMAADAAWTAGNVGRMTGTGTTGKIHDQGSTTIPSAGRYVIFLDSGGSAGIATVLICSAAY